MYVALHSTAAFDSTLRHSISLAVLKSEAGCWMDGVRDSLSGAL
jgi:hypothetical protein